MKTIKFLALCFIVILSSCQTQQEHDNLDTPTSGNLTIYADRGLDKLIENQTYTFSQIYNLAKFKTIYSSEQEAIKALYDDTCKVIALNRTLSKDEEQQFKQANIFLSSSLIGKSAIVLIVNKDAMDTTINMENLQNIISGDTTNSYYNSIVFENEKSSAATYCKDSLTQGKALGKNCYAVKNVNELLALIITNKKAIGFIDYSWISDSDDSLAKSIKSKCKIIAVAAKGNETAYYPDQSNIQTDDYPLTRHIYLTRRGQDFSLAAGFITFVAGPKGQVMLLKTGFAPWRQPERMISIDMKPIN